MWYLSFSFWLPSLTMIISRSIHFAANGIISFLFMAEWVSEVAQSCLTLCDPMDYSLPGSSVDGIFQAIVLQWIAMSFSRGSSQPRDRIQVSRIVDRHCTVWTTREVLLLLLSRFSSVPLCATPEMAAHQAPPSLRFSRQERWSGLPFPSPVHESEKWKWSRSVVSHPERPHGLQPTRLLHPLDFPGKSTGMGCHCLLRGKSWKWKWSRSVMSDSLPPHGL